MFDDRVLNIGIEVNGQMQFYNGAAGVVKITKSSDSKQNACTISIDNLLLETIDYLVTETSPWNPSQKPKLITVMAGRQSTGVERPRTGQSTSGRRDLHQRPHSYQSFAGMLLLIIRLACVLRPKIRRSPTMSITAQRPSR